MKKLILAISVFVTMFVASFSVTAGTVTDYPYHETVTVGNVQITYEYDGPGGKLINVIIEHID